MASKEVACPFCGEKNTPDSTICDFCGRRLKAGSSAPPAEEEVEEEATGLDLSDDRARYALIGAGVGILLLLIMIGRSLFGGSPDGPMPTPPFEVATLVGLNYDNLTGVFGEPVATEDAPTPAKAREKRKLARWQRGNSVLEATYRVNSKEVVEYFLPSNASEQDLMKQAGVTPDDVKYQVEYLAGEGLRVIPKVKSRPNAAPAAGTVVTPVAPAVSIPSPPQ